MIDKTAPAPEQPRIFVHIPSYRDRDTANTVAELFAKARHPERVFVGIVWQLMPGIDDDLLFVSPRKEQIRELTYDARESRGVGWARAHCQSLWRGEEYVLQIDAHHRFADGWDELLLQQLAACPSEKAVLSTYPQGFRLPNTIINGSPLLVVFKEFDANSQIPALTSRLLTKEEQAEGRPVRSAFCAAGFLFGPSQVLKDIPYDPYIYFSGEEIALALRLFTSGWDVYAPARHILWHLWDKSSRPTHWQDNADFATLQLRGHRRLRHLLGIEASSDPEVLRELDRFGLGPLRSKQEFEEFSGVEFATKKIADRARRGQFEEARMTKKIVPVVPHKTVHAKSLKAGRGPEAAPEAPAIAAARPRPPRKVLETEQFTVFDDFLPEEVYEQVHQWALYSDYQHVNTGDKISRTWRPHDGFPMRGLRNCFYQTKPPAPEHKKAWQFPTGTAYDLFAERVAENAPEVERLIGRRDVDWKAFSVTSFLYPARTGLSLHRDGREVYTGAYTFFMAPHWDIHWGGLLVVLDKRTEFPSDVVTLYGQGKSIKNVWLDREREASFAFEPGFGQVVLPKRNRIAFLNPDCYHFITFVNEFAGDNVRMAFSGFFHSKDEQKGS